jgi:hypothetical protein
MKALINLAAVSLSIVLGLIPFAVIAVDDVVVAKADMHALGAEGR